MSQLRYNPLSREWVIIATDRAKRPEDFKRKKDLTPMPEYKDNCPFCVGNESKTPQETFRIGDQNSWKVRAVYNLYGALSIKDEPTRDNSGLHHSINGFGNHEVIIENPKHNQTIALMDLDQVENIIKVYKERYCTVEKIKGIEDITIFKNHGSSAGTSLEHPHSQLIATPIVPPQVRARIENASQYFDSNGKCLFCSILEEELQEKTRIVFESDKFVAFEPFASASPFVTWIFPRRHMSSFSNINDSEIRDLAVNLRTTLNKLYNGLENPSYNFTIRSMPVKETENEYYHWHIVVVPRINQPAGFELGSGIFISTALPEESAKFLREIKAN